MELEKEEINKTEYNKCFTDCNIIKKYNLSSEKKKVTHTILYAVDLHGEYYNTLLERGAENDISSIVIGGDILPKKSGIDGNTFFGMQESFILNTFVPKLGLFKKKCNKPVYLMMGNDDLACNMDLLERGEKEGLFNLLHNKVYNLTKDMQICGYGCVPLTPFSIKDWEKYDTLEEINDRETRFSGYKSRKDENGFKFEMIDFRDLDRKDTVENDLEMLVKKVKNPQRTIFVTHAPPHDTKLDMVNRYMKTKHVGSVAVRKFIEKYQPFATLHGHIHESQGSEKIGKTICINPGRSYEQLNAVRFGF